MKIKIEVIFIWIFIISLIVLGISYIMLIFNLIKPIIMVIIHGFKYSALISITILSLIWVVVKLRSDYELLVLVDNQWKSVGIFDSISTIHQYIDEHEKLLYEDYKIIAIEKNKIKKIQNVH